MQNKTCIVIFSDDFRVKDNQAFFNACFDFTNIIPLYIYNENYLGREIGSASKVFLHEVLKSFQSLLKNNYNLNLIFKKGLEIDVLNEIYNNCKFDAIYFNHSYSEKQINTEKQIKDEFLKKKIIVKSFKGKILFEPQDIFTLSGSYFKVFTPFGKECLRKFKLIGETLPEPNVDDFLKKNNQNFTHNITTLKIEDLNLLPMNEGGWVKNLLKYWHFDYNKIETDFIDFTKNKLESYSENRNYPNKNGNSKLSPYFRFGMISVRFCFNLSSEFIYIKNNQFILELLWREFAYHVMFYNQNIAQKELKEEYSNFEWEDNEYYFQQWTKGKTGYDIVDAGMTELYETGFMHNRLRMITASFLIKDLFIDWRKGEKWFWHTLVDSDYAINTFNWQWTFGSGLDAAPYFRIFNPKLQKERFDENGIYCKQWLGQNWKENKIVDHDIQKKIAMEKYFKIKKDDSVPSLKKDKLVKKTLKEGNLL